MDTITAAALQKAYELIKVGNQPEALAILIPIIKTNQNIAEAWYLMGFAVTEREKRLYAFEQVVRIDPSNQSAKNQIAKLTVIKPVTSPFTVMPDLSNMPAPQTARQPDIERRPPPYPVVASEPDEVEPVESPKKRRLSPIQIGALIFAACVACGVIWLILGRGSASGPLVFAFRPSPTSPPSASATPRPLPSPTVYLPVLRGTACSFTIPLGTRVRCGAVRVPQDRQKSLTDLIELPVVIYQSEKSDADAVLFLQGGPGVESIDWSLSFFQDYVKPILAEHDMVFFDPRGTGRSKPALDCPELNPVFLDAYYQNRSQDDAFKDFLASWSKCHDRFLAQGVDPATFNTNESAADVRDIVLALGYEKVNLLGISYGTRLGLTVMRDYPEIVRSVVLDSVVPVEAKMFNRRSLDTQYALDKVFSDCAGNPLCNRAYPDLGNVFNTLVETFDEKPATIKVLDPATGFVSTITANGVDMVSAVVSGMHNSDLVPVVPKAIYDIQNGDYTFLSFALGVRGGTYNTTGLGTYFATVCPEQVYVSSAEALDADLDISPLLKKYALTGLFGSTQNLFELCAAWGAKEANAQQSLPVTADIPALVISGQYDPTTPATTGEMVANTLPHNYFYIMPGMGHGATMGNACSMAIMIAFLREPEKTPDSTCLQPGSFEFFLPYNGSQSLDLVPVTDPINLVEGVVPAGWKRELPSGSYFRRAYLFDTTLVQFISLNFPQSVVLEALATGFQDNGFEGTPQKTAVHYVNGFTWTIYDSKFNGEPVVVALASVNNFRTIGLIMVASAAERDAFYDGLFIPMLNQLVPLQ